MDSKLTHLASYLGERPTYTVTDLHAVQKDVSASQELLERALEYHVSFSGNIKHSATKFVSEKVFGKPYTIPDIAQTLELQEANLTQYVTVLESMIGQSKEQHRAIASALDNSIQQSRLTIIPQVPQNGRTEQSLSAKRSRLHSTHSAQLAKRKKELLQNYAHDYDAIETALAQNIFVLEKTKDETELFRDYVHNTKGPFITLGLHAGTINLLSERMSDMQYFTRNLEDSTADAVKYMSQIDFRKTQPFTLS